MSKINQIEKALDEIDATKFHKLIDSYLSKKYSIYCFNPTFLHIFLKFFLKIYYLLV